VVADHPQGLDIFIGLRFTDEVGARGSRARAARYPFILEKNKKKNGGGKKNDKTKKKTYKKQ